jgi:small subunit ribosomal protein S16
MPTASSWTWKSPRPGVVKARVHNNPQKAQPKKKAQERAAAAAKAAEAA